VESRSNNLKKPKEKNIQRKHDSILMNGNKIRVVSNW